MQMHRLKGAAEIVTDLTDFGIPTPTSSQGSKILIDAPCTAVDAG
jgi:hypothetical protein